MEVARPAIGVAAAAMLGVTCVGRTLFWFEGGGPFPPGPPGLLAILLGKWAVANVPPPGSGTL
jgi:hypothetical protein